MDIKLKKAQSILKKYNQEHLLQFYNELDEIQRKVFLKEIFKTDFKGLNKLYKNSFNDDSIDPKKIAPIEYVSSMNLDYKQRDFYKSIGERIISNGELAVITLAGGQGTRLGYKGPKGCYEIDVPPKKSLFEFLCDKLKKAYSDYGVYLNWYIMTSIYNDEETKMYFERKNYFGYPKDKIYFFKQDALPLVDKEGKVILDRIYSLKEVSNGNGDVFRAFNKAKLISTLSKVEWISVSGVDNILLEIVDPVFLGIASYHNSDVAAKSIAKKDIQDKGWVFAKVSNRTDIIDSTNLSEEMLNSKNEKGLYNYNQINILSHLFTKRAFLESMNIKMPYHRAFKKNDYINEEGVKTVPTEPNSFEFEKFIFDAFKYFDNFTLLEVLREDEFAPIKAFTGDSTPEIALELYLDKCKRKY